MAEAAGPSTVSPGVDTKSDSTCTGEHFVDKHQSELIKRVSDVEPILDELLCRNIIQQESYDEIKTLPTAEEKMRELISGPLKSIGVLGKDIFYEILIENQPLLIQDLKRMEAEVETMSTLVSFDSAGREDIICSKSLSSRPEVRVSLPRVTLPPLPFLRKQIKDQKKETTSTQRLCETLTDLSTEELEKFKSLIELEKGFPLFSRKQLKMTKTPDIVELIVETYRQDCLELTKSVLKKMNRIDLVQRLTDTEEKHRPSLIQRVETMESVVEQLLETLKYLSDAELKKFQDILAPLSSHERYGSLLSFQAAAERNPLIMLGTTDMKTIVLCMMQAYSQQTVEMTKEVLNEMERTDLVQRLSDSSFRPKQNFSMDRHMSALIHKAATMGAVKELLLETLNDLSYEEQMNFTWFLQFTFFKRSLPLILGKTIWWGQKDWVKVTVETCGEESLEVIKQVFIDMNRIDLVQRLSESSSPPKGSSAEVFGVDTTEGEKQSLDEHWPALISKVEMMESVTELLLETLKYLSDTELKEFIKVLRKTDFHRNLDIPWSLVGRDRQQAVFTLMLSHGQQSVEMIKGILEKMKRTDLVQRLSDNKDKMKHSADEHPSALIHKVATIAAVKELLLGTLNDLSDEELKNFKKFLQLTVFQKDLPDILWMLKYRADRADIVNQMVQTYGQQSVELTREVFMDMNRTDLLQRLSKPSSGLKEKHRPAASERAATKAAVKKILLKTLDNFSHKERMKFKWLLQFTHFEKSLPQFSWRRVDWEDRTDRLVDQLVETCGQQSVEVTKEVLMDMNRTDLVKRLSEASSGLKGPSRRLEHEGCGSTLQDSSDWTKLEPEVNSTDADEASTYSLQSEAGNFECSVSGLRWVCKEKVSFKYQFCSWEEPMERMESMKYMLAGPLIDITVNAGKLDEVFLPHWICIDDNPEIRDKFAVLHIDDCGDVVEKVAEVTSSHVKLSDPVFSPRAVLMKVGVPVKINCNVLIYKTDTAFLTLHVYLIPCDPGLQQELNRRQFSSGYRAIQKPHPEKSLKMRDRFILTADLDGAKIYPENLKLRYESRFPNFFEVYIKKPDTDFTLSLAQKNERQPVWTREIRKDEYQSTGHKQVEHFVDKHQCDLIARVSNTGPILDNLLREGVIQQEDYDTIGTIPTTQERMRKLFSGPLKAGGQAAKDVFFRILEEKESYLVADLKRKET
ncbi:uncharacterized protein AB9X84_023336 [Acanthopagrus schlegelii]